MVRLEDIKPRMQLAGLVPGEVAEIIQVVPVGADAATVYYKAPSTGLSERQLYRTDEAALSVPERHTAWSFDAPPDKFKLALEAYRIQSGYLFDPWMAVHSSNIEPLPHQLAAVYETMLEKKPLRFVLADDPGAGKTVMAGLLIKELLLRGDARRVLVVAPGSLTEQWQDELRDKFALEFRLFSRAEQEQSASGNFFAERDLVIARLDQLSRSSDLKERLAAAPPWDLVVIDEAHKLSAHQFSNEIKRTQRFQFGELLSRQSRHLLLMTATPHNGKDEDFQAWLTLLDCDRFYGVTRDGGMPDVSDIMRRLVKEQLVRFDGTPLFPERRAYTVKYELSDAEAELYEAVTEYVREGMNRAKAALADDHKQACVGFALTMLQRRLASSPEAIYQSLRRRRVRLEEELARLRRAECRGRPSASYLDEFGDNEPEPLFVREDGPATVEVRTTRSVEIPNQLDDIEDELDGDEFERVAEELVDSRTAAASIPEFEAEIATLRELEEKARLIRAAAATDAAGDRKWAELSSVLQGGADEESRRRLFHGDGRRRKIIVFTEHKDTLDYLATRIRRLLGRDDAVATISGSTKRLERKAVQDEFRNNPDLVVLVATDAAGEGVNLQVANLMVNYDLPWNPNRLEQRFGRIHRIGQTEVCHLWNLVAANTREGEVFLRLFEKLEVERQALGGRVFDILGDAFDEIPLKDLLLDAILDGERPEVRARMHQAVDRALDNTHLNEILRRQALVQEAMSPEQLFAVRSEMEKAEARKLQPCFVGAFCRTALAALGGEARKCEEGRWKIPNVPPAIRLNDRVLGLTREHVATKYERICFDKARIQPEPGMPRAEFVHPGHPLLRSIIDLVLEKGRGYLQPGAVLVDPNDPDDTPSVVFLVDHAVREEISGRVLSREVQFVRMSPAGFAQNAGFAPHLDLEVPDEAALAAARDILAQPWLADGSIGERALAFATDSLAKDHFDRVKSRRIAEIEKTLAAVQTRLADQILYWNDRAVELQRDVEAGRQIAIQPIKARNTAKELQARLDARKKALDAQRHVVSSAPSLLGGILVIPQGLLDRRAGLATRESCIADAAARTAVELAAMRCVMEAERRLGHEVHDVSADKCGWDVTAIPPSAGPGRPAPLARHIEVKGRAKGATDVTVTHNEVFYGINQADKFLLAVVFVGADGSTDGPHYVRNPFTAGISDEVVSQKLSLPKLLARSVPAERSVAPAR